MTQTQLFEAILQDESFQSIDQSDSFQDFLNSRQNDLDESEISEQYRGLDGKALKFEAGIRNLYPELYSKENGAGNTLDAFVTARTRNFQMPDKDYSIGGKCT